MRHANGQLSLATAFVVEVADGAGRVRGKEGKAEGGARGRKMGGRWERTKRKDGKEGKRENEGGVKRNKH